VKIFKPGTWDDYDEVLWNTDGAKSAPKGANNDPPGLPAKIFKFQKGLAPS